MKYIILSISLLFFFNGFSYNYDFEDHFKEAYHLYPSIPLGILEAVSYTQTRMQHLNVKESSCIGIPKLYGVMGLVLDGKNYFNNNLNLISKTSGYTIDSIINSPRLNILSYAKAFSVQQKKLNIESADINKNLKVLKILSEIPFNNNAQKFAFESYLYSVLYFLSNDDFMNKMGYNDIQNVNFKEIFGEENYFILSSQKIIINGEDVSNEDGLLFQSCLDYPNANWIEADPSNWSFRNGSSITAITIHTVQGSYSGCISWFQNPAANVSAHYVIRSFDGQITQMVCESNKAWHVGTENSYTIGIEHEGFVDNPVWYTNSMYSSSATLVKDIVSSGYLIDPLSTYQDDCQCVLNSCYRIKGHVNFPNQTHTDPGIFWNWPYYYSLINNNILTHTYTSDSGNFYDTGGSQNSYNSFENYLTIISPPNANSISLNFNQFSTELGYDTLSIYDGIYPNSNLLGTFSGANLPPEVVANSGVMSILFKSDCLYNYAGWDATWTSAVVSDLDGDGYVNGIDCNDNNSSIYPGANEICDGIDNNCDGIIDNSLTDLESCQNCVNGMVVSSGSLMTYYLDLDEDGYGNSSDSQDLCNPSGFYTATISGDCDDLDFLSYPGATEICGDGIDQNCDNLIDDACFFSVSGYFTYDDVVNTALENVQIILAHSNNFIFYPTTTDANGYYQFTNIPPGEYTLLISYLMPWGGVNSTDALLVLQEFLGMNNLIGIKLNAADVDGDGIVNSTDGLLIRQRYLSLINSFQVEDWVFELTTINVYNTDVVKSVKGVCSGDVNASKYGY